MAEKDDSTSLEQVRREVTDDPGHPVANEASLYDSVRTNRGIQRAPRAPWEMPTVIPVTPASTSLPSQPPDK